jgi:hemoglobin
MSEASLYERLGGVYAIAAVVDHFSDQLVELHTIESNSRINEWNETKADQRLPGLKFLRTLWLSAESGGPFQYTRKTLTDAHFEFKLTSGDFDSVAAVLADSLDHYSVPSREREEVLAAFAAHKPEVTAGSASPS